MMHHSHSKPHRTGVQSQSLILLCGWLGSTLGVGALSLSHPVYANELEDLGVPAAAPTAPAADTFIDPPEPAWEPAPAPAVPVAPAPVAPAAPAPVALPANPPTPPAISPRVMPQVAEEPVEQPAENAYIDSESYNLGETATIPKSTKSVSTGSVSGCQANLNIDPVLAATLCGPPVVKTAQQQPQVYTASAYKPAAASRSYAYTPPAPASQWTAPSTYAPSKTPTPWATNAPTSLNLAKASPSLRGLPPSPNPLKWLIPNQQRMIFPLPVPASITSAFGWRVHPISGTSSFHAGTDLAAPTGTPVLAAFPGQVDTSGFMGGYGLSVLLRHQQGQTATRYAHLSKIYVQPGQWVSQGTILGLVGSTGNSTGPHLHFETLEKKNDSLVTIDPGIQIKVSLAELIKAMQTAKVPPQGQS